MRTTLTLDDDLAKLVDQEMKRSGDSYKSTVNRLLRMGLDAASRPKPEKPFVVRAIPLGVGNMLDHHKGSVSALLEELEGPAHR